MSGEARARDPIQGRASVIDGDTIEIHGERIRLEGIDAPESRQSCGDGAQAFRCGRDAAFALSNLLGERTVRCAPTGRDRYQRTLARCYLGDQDLQAWLVTQGHALAFRRYSTDYISHEDQARAQRRGMWRAEIVVAPWDWRKRGASPP